MSQAGDLLVVVPSATASPRLPASRGGREHGVGRQIDLDDGSVTPFAWERAGGELQPVGLGRLSTPCAFLPEVTLEELEQQPGLYQRPARMKA